MPDPSAAASRHLVLIHGAWQGSWAFDAWRPLLEAHGWHTHAVDLPGNGWGPQGAAPASLAAYTDHVVATVLPLAGTVVLVGHSGGGITASQVAEAVPERIAGVVYLAGMMLPNGVTFRELLESVIADTPDANLAGIVSWLDWNEARTQSRVLEPGALQCFFHDCEPAAARAAAARLRLQPETGRAMHNRLSPERYGRVPRVYVECRDDRSLALAVQRRMQRLSPGATRLTMDCGHVPQLANPAGLTRLLLPALDAGPSGRIPCSLPGPQ